MHRTGPSPASGAPSADPRLPAGAAAHHPVTAQVAVDLLHAGGSAADAAVGGSFAACVAESVLTGLAGGGFAMCWDARTGTAEALDFFVDVPRRAASAPPAIADIDFGSQVVPYVIGPASVAVPGLVAGLGALWERFGVLPWARLLQPAIELATTGVALPPQHAAVLDMLAAVLTAGEGGRVYAPDGRPLRTGERLHQPGLATALRIVADEGPDSFRTGTLAQRVAELMRERGGGLAGDDLAGYTPRWHAPGVHDRGRHRLLARDDLGRLREVVAAADHATARGAGRAGRAVAAARAVSPGTVTGTTNLTVVDEAGSAVVVSTSMGLSSGDWLPDLDLHLNSMLGERPLLVEAPVAGQRLASNMVPILVVDDDGVVLAAGGAGSARIPSAMVQVLLAVLDDGVDPQAAVEAPRWHVADGVAHHEDGVDPDVIAALASVAADVRRWPARHYYFGGVNLVSRQGAAFDPRRSGGVALLHG